MRFKKLAMNVLFVGISAMSVVNQASASHPAELDPTIQINCGSTHIPGITYPEWVTHEDNPTYDDCMNWGLDHGKWGSTMSSEREWQGTCNNDVINLQQQMAARKTWSACEAEAVEQLNDIVIVY